MQKYKHLVVLATLLCCGNGLELPPNFKICKQSDSNINDCLKVAIQDALPTFEKDLPEEFKLSSAQPVKVENLTIGEGKGAVHVEQHFKNMKIYNIPLAKIENVKATILSNGLSLEIDALMSEVKMEADYALDGRILVLPISGKGKSTIIFISTKVHVIINAEAFEKKGMTYLEAKTVKVHLEPSEIVFDFENLFNGDERLGKEMNNVLNENWKEIWEDVGSSYEEFLAVIVRNYCNGILKKVPFDKIFPK